MLIFWNNYRWGAADVLLMEEDNVYNFKDLTKLIIDVLDASLTAAGYPQSKPFALLGKSIIDALPDSAMTNDHDYVDVYYTLEENQRYDNYPGASGNAEIDLAPRIIDPR
ncbi:hypothetical protein VSWAT3_22155 [Vibrionales bacterium SWAT-3]|nr:hypothetical protein VSWAT3_22155 [Vibrionales bacterium SWAT-3]